MGGAISGPVNKINSSISGIPIIGKAADALLRITPVGVAMNVAADIDRSVTDPGGAKNTASNAQTAQNQALTDQQTQAASLQKTLLTQPKNITPDNFLANKAAQLAGLRLGIAGTVTGAGGAPGPILGSTSLTGNYPGKVKLGQ